LKNLATNRKAFFDYEIIEKYEVGIILLGSEVKSVKNGKVSLKESFISIKDKKVIWKQGYIDIPLTVVFDRPSETRERTLLLNKSEINKLEKNVSLNGLTIVPLNIYLNDKNKIKMEIALARGKKLYDKREDLKNKDLKRESEQNIKNFY